MEKNKNDGGDDNHLQLQFSAVETATSISPPETLKISSASDIGVFGSEPTSTSLSWPSWSRSSCLFPGLSNLQMPLLYPLVSSTSAQSTSSPDLHKKETDQEKINDLSNTPLKLENQEGKYPSTAASHYQVKWSNHSSRLTSFVTSLEGDVASSDVVLTSRDGTTYYAHRIVMASASSFFNRTLKNISREQTAVIVIPRASARFISAILSFCYTGSVAVPIEDVKQMFELAEDLEITGLLVEKSKERYLNLIKNSLSSPSPIFNFTQPLASFSSDDIFTSARTTTPPYSPLYPIYPPTSFSPTPISAPPSSYKRDGNVGLSNQISKRIKSESDIIAFEGGSKISQAGTSWGSTSSFTDELPTSSSAFNNFYGKLVLSNGPRRNLSHPQVPEQAGIGSRILLWRFLLELLHDSRCSPYYIRWLDRQKGIFRIMESDKVAQLWGMARKNKNMTYEKMSRGMRTYYKTGILAHLDGTKLIYKFNIDEPKIQHQLKYHTIMLRKSEESTFETMEDEEMASNESEVVDSLKNFPFRQHLMGISSLLKEEEK